VRWLTTDQVRCLDCRRTTTITTRWTCEGRQPKCGHCGSRAVERKDTLLRQLRDLMVMGGG